MHSFAESTSFLVSEGHVDLSGSALFPFVRYLSRAICYLLKQALIISQPAVSTVRTYVGVRVHKCRSRIVGVWFIKH